MPRDERRRQKALARKAGKRKQRKAAGQLAHVGGHISLRMATEWPLYECLLSRSWSEPGHLVQILLARSADIDIAVASFLVDLGCLGVKNALSNVVPPSEYEHIRRTLAQLQPLERADLNLVAKIIEEGIAYARSLGFSPHPDYRQAAILLADAHPEECDTPIPVGMARARGRARQLQLRGGTGRSAGGGRSRGSAGHCGGAGRAPGLPFALTAPAFGT